MVVTLQQERPLWVFASRQMNTLPATTAELNR